MTDFVEFPVDVRSRLVGLLRSSIEERLRQVDPQDRTDPNTRWAAASEVWHNLKLSQRIGYLHTVHLELMYTLTATVKLITELSKHATSD